MPDEIDLHQVGAVGDTDGEKGVDRAADFLDAGHRSPLVDRCLAAGRYFTENKNILVNPDSEGQ